MNMLERRRTSPLRREGLVGDHTHETGSDPT